MTDKSQALCDVLSQMERKRIVDCVSHNIDLAEKEFGLTLINNAPPIICFNQTGIPAARYEWDRNLYAFNPFIFKRNKEAFLEDTVPHEVSHHVHCVIMEDVPLVDESHGAIWQGIMATLGHPGASEYHEYNTARVPGAPSYFVYKCQCTTRQLALSYYKETIKGVQFNCACCNTRLVYLPPVIKHVEDQTGMNKEEVVRKFMLLNPHLNMYLTLDQLRNSYELSDKEAVDIYKKMNNSIWWDNNA
jgi:SprT protein